MVDSTFIRLKNNWIAAADQLVSEDKAIAHAVVIFVRGSSPREVGANMVISETQIWNTIGSTGPGPFGKSGTPSGVVPSKVSIPEVFA